MKRSQARTVEWSCVRLYFVQSWTEKRIIKLTNFISKGQDTPGKVSPALKR